MNIDIDIVVAALGVVASISAAGVWLGAALPTVPDNIDTIIGALRTQSQRNAYAASSAALAALCAAFEFLRHSLMLV